MASKLKCTNCGKTKTTDKNFYLSHSLIYSKNEERLPICKECTLTRYKTLLEKYKDETKALYHLCMNLDVYFDKSLVKGVQSKMKEKDNLAKMYLSKVNSLQQYKGLTSIDSDLILLDESVAKELFEEHEENTQDNLDGFKITPEIVKRWGGDRLSLEDYFFLESNYKEFTSVYDDKTPAQKLIFRQMSKALLQGEKALKEGNTKGFENMNNLVSKLMNDGNIKPIQEAIIAEDDTQGWGIWVNRIETERPVGEACEQFKDVDKIREYITKWFTKQLQKVMDIGGGK